jgi:two-component system sensor histidine kinase YesM
MTVIPISIGGIVSFVISRDARVKEALRSSQQVLQLASGNINRIIYDTQKILYLISINDDIQKILQSNPSNDLEKLKLSIDLGNKYLSNYMIQYSFLSSIVIYADNFDYAFVHGELGQIFTKDFKKFTVYNDAKKLQGRILWYPPRTYEGSYSGIELENIVSVVKSINILEDFKPVGVAEIHIKKDVITKIIKEIKDDYGSAAFVLDSEGRVIIAGNDSLKESLSPGIAVPSAVDETTAYGRIDDTSGNKYVINYTTLDNGWRLVHVTPYDALLKSSRQIGAITLIIILGFISLALLLSFIVSNSITKPVRELIRSMNIVKDGNFDVNIYYHGKNEIGQLGETFNIMVVKIKNLISELLIQQKKKKEAELNVLQAQISPHFLYNTLNMIKCMAVIKHEDEIANVTKALTSLLELSINNKRDFINIEDEIEIAAQYILLQKHKLSRKFNVSIHVPEELYSYKTLKLILQPLIENSILHAFKENEKVYDISISVEKQEESIVMNVSDNGIGMSEERIYEVLSSTSKHGKFNRIGINNLNERIKLYFGEDYGLLLKSEINKGTLVTVRIPAFKNEEYMREVGGINV